MARIPNSITFGSGFNITSTGPIDSRTVVEYESDLTSGDTWTTETGRAYKGMTVSVIETGDVWVLVDWDYTDINNWQKVGKPIGYSFDKNTGAFIEGEGWIEWVESGDVLGEIVSIDISGEANSTTYLYTGSFEDIAKFEYLLNIVMVEYGYDAYVKISDDRYAKIANLDTENKIVRLSKTLDKNNSVDETILYYGAYVENQNRATGRASHAESAYNTASGDYSHAEGCDNIATGDYSHVEGLLVKAYGGESHAEGNWTTASGESSHAEGYYTTASGEASHAEGNWTTASGETSHAEGDSSTASGYASHAEGRSSTASGYASHAEGNWTTAGGDYSHSEGGGDYISFGYIIPGGASISEDGIYLDSPSFGDMSDEQLNIAIGCFVRNNYDEDLVAKIIEVDRDSNTGVTRLKLSNSINNSGSVDPGNNLQLVVGVADGECSHSEGSGTTASVDYSHAEGALTNTVGIASHAEGVGTKTLNYGEHAEGCYNQPHENTISSIGIGTGIFDRQNAFEVLSTGDVFIKGIGDYNGDKIISGTTRTIQNVIENIGDEIYVSVEDVLAELNYDDNYDE